MTTTRTHFAWVVMLSGSSRCVRKGRKQDGDERDRDREQGRDDVASTARGRS